MLNLNINKRSLGVTFNEAGEAHVRLWSPLSKELSLVLKGPGETVPMVKKDLGFWELSTSRLKDGDTYKFLLDGEKERPDPVSLAQPDGVHGASMAIDLSNFSWTDEGWENPAISDYVFYELHTGTFTLGSSFSGIEQKLDYLKELGITAIEIMPVAQFPGSRNWGYDGVLPYAVQFSYGGARGLQQLVNACHRKGIAVVLDVVYNHVGPEGNYLADYGPYFTDKYNTPWGNAINFDDAWCDGVRQYFIENTLMWFRDFHIDALRLDAVHAIKDLSPIHILREIKQHVDELMQLTGRKHYLVVELDLNDNRFINPLEQQGYGMDAQWIDEFHHSLRITAGGSRSGYYADFEDIGHLAKAYTDAYVYDGQYSPHRLKTFGVKAEDNPGNQFVVFSQNHDQVGNRMLGERTSTLLSFEMQKLLAGAVVISPYLPMLFMGEEWSEPHPFLYFVSHTDPELAEAVRKGRKAEFAAFHAEGEAPDPMSEETFRSSMLQWELLSQEPHKTMLEYYRTLLQLRKQQPALHNCNRKQLNTEIDKDKNTLILRRWQDTQHLVCLLNFSTGKQPFVLPPSNTPWRKLLVSSDTSWGGAGSAPEEITGTSTFVAEPESISIYMTTYD